MSTIGDIMSTIEGYLEYRGDTQYCGGYHDAMGDIMMPWGISWVPWGCSVPWGKIFCYLSTPWYWTPSTVLMISLTCIMISPMVPKLQRMVSPRYWTPPTVLMISLMCIMIPPAVLSISHGTQDNSPWYLWYPPRCSWFPHVHHDIPHGTEHPSQYSTYPPHASWCSPRYCTHPTVLHTHTQTHTLYRVRISIFAASCISDHYLLK